MSKQRRIIFGPPGTGKTTRLMTEMTRHIAAGTDPSRIGFLSFTRRAIREAKDKAAEVTEDELPYFRTIHSLAYLMLGLGQGEVVTGVHLLEFGARVGMPFKATTFDAVLFEGALGDKCLGLWALARARGTSLGHEWRFNPGLDVPWKLVRDTVALYEQFKGQQGLSDFDDMIARAEGALDVDILFVDEAQDTSAAQWTFLKRVASHVPVVYLAGDDDQAIYHWSGADPAQLLRFAGERDILPTSYRLPRAVKNLADTISRRIGTRVEKQFDARDGDGAVGWNAEPDSVDLHGAGTFLLLARSNYQLGQLREQARRQGVIYTLPDGNWSHTLPSVRAAVSYERLRHDKPITRLEARRLNSFLTTRVPLPRKDEVRWGDVFPGSDNKARERTWMDALTNMPVKDRAYVRALRRTGESLHEPGRVRIGTVHSVKGAEADHVVLLTDISDRVMRSTYTDPDAERRVQYVGVTRARETLTLILPQSDTFWSF